MSEEKLNDFEEEEGIVQKIYNIRNLFRVVGWSICFITIAITIFYASRFLSYVSLISLCVTFLDKSIPILEWVRWIFVHRFIIRGRRNIYNYKIELIKKARHEILFYTPVTCFGAYSVGMKTFYRIVDSLKKCIERGRTIKIISDVPDSKGVHCLKLLIDTGADIRIRRAHDPWHYFLITDNVVGLCPRTAEQLKTPDGRTWRVISHEAEKIKGDRINELINQFNDDWKNNTEPVSDFIKELNLKRTNENIT